MAHFIHKCLIWFFVLFVLLLGVEAVIYYSGFRFASYNGLEIIHALKKSKGQSKKRLLILGDSVCNQLYPSSQEYADAVSLACNQAVSMAGHYSLMNNYIQSNEDSLPDAIVLIYSPSSLTNALDSYAYHYMLKTFYTKEYKPLYDDVLWRQIRQIPFYWTASLPFIRISNYSFEYQIPYSYDSVSDLSSDYLSKMLRLAQDKGISFTMLGAPAPVSKKEDYTHIMSDPYLFMGDIRTLKDAYRNSLVFLPDNQFNDMIHFKTGYVPEDFFQLL